MEVVENKGTAKGADRQGDWDFAKACGTPTPRSTEKSAQTFDSKEVEILHDKHGVRICLDVKEIEEVREVKEWIGGCGRSVGVGGGESCNMLTWNYDTVNTPVSD